MIQCICLNSLVCSLTESIFDFLNRAHQSHAQSVPLAHLCDGALIKSHLTMDCNSDQSECLILSIEIEFQLIPPVFIEIENFIFITCVGIVFSTFSSPFLFFPILPSVE